MTGRRSDLREWWLKRFESLKGNKKVTAEQLYTGLPNSLKNVVDRDGEWGYWTLFKLAIHAYYLPIYTNIIKKWFSPVAYVDTFAGCGLIKVGKDKPQYFLGSALLSILIPKGDKRFDRFILIDADPDKINVLKSLLEQLSKRGHILKSSYEAICDDMNKLQYERLLKDCKHSLSVIDPYGLEPNFSTIQVLAALPCDLIINYMESGVKRVFGDKEKNREKLSAFFGKDVYDVDDSEVLYGLYLENIRRLNRKTFDISVKGLGGFGYKIIFAVRPTKGDNPWLNALNKLKDRVEDTKRETFETILKQFAGEQASLD
ncbi:MAG: three-Cys-motif partner protein TcmP [Nitrososphaerota archaeon]